MSENIGLIAQIAHSFSKTTGYDVEDLIQEGILKELEVKHKYNKKLKYSTFLHTVVSQHFCRIIEKNKYSCYANKNYMLETTNSTHNKEINESYINRLVNNLEPEQNIIFKESIDNLSVEARHICYLLFTGDDRLDTGKTKLSGIKQNIREYLREERGLKFKTIDNIIEELHNVVGTSMIKIRKKKAISRKIRNKKIGNKYNKWEVIDDNEYLQYKTVKVFCRCKCGNEKMVDLFNLENKKSLSCGCLGRKFK